MDFALVQTKRIAVVGIGGVGGYLAGMLGRVCAHLTLGARGARGEALRQHGLMLHSERNGEIAVRPERVVPASQMGEQDYLFLCVKNYSLEAVCRELKGAVTEETVVIPVMNGADPGERVRRLLGRGMVVDSLIYIVAYANEDHSVTQKGDFASLRIGIPQATEKEQKKIQEVSDLLTAAQIDHRVAADIETEIWRKYILNCAYNVASACYDNTVGQLRSDPVKAREYESLVREAYQVARAKGVGVKPEHAEVILHRFYHVLAADSTSSLQRDIRSGRPAEVDTFSGYLVREAERLGVSVPVTERFYGLLKAKEGEESI